MIIIVIIGLFHGFIGSDSWKIDKKLGWERGGKDKQHRATSPDVRT